MVKAFILSPILSERYYSLILDKTFFELDESITYI